MRLILAYLLFVQSVMAQLPPTTLQGQAGAKQTTFNFQVPNRQATQTGGVNQLIETGNRNLLANPGFEHQTYSTSWTTGGTATYSAETAAPLSGLKSFKAVASAQTIDLIQDTTLYAAARAGSQLFFRFVATNTAAGVTACVRKNGVKQTGSNDCLTLATDGIARTYELAFLAHATSNGIEIDSASTTGTLVVDDVEISTDSSSFIDVAQIGPWVDYGPMTITATTTNPTKATVKQEDSVRCRIVGQDYECEYKYRADSATGAAAGSGGYLFALPSGVEFDSSQSLATISTATGSSSDTAETSKVAARIGTGVLAAAGAATHNTAWAFAVSGNRFQVCFLNGLTNGGCANSSFYNLTSANTSYQFTVKFRGKGLTNKISTYSQFAVSDVSVENVFSAKVSAAGVVSDENLDFNNGNCTLTATNLFTCTFNSGIFTVAPNCSVEAVEATGVSRQATIQSISSTTLAFRTNDAAGGQIALPTNIICTKQGVDYKAKNVITGTFQNIEKCADPYECTDTFSAKVSAAGVVSGENLDWINGNCTISSTSIFTCLYVSGLSGGGGNLTATMNCTITQDQSAFTFGVRQQSTSSSSQLVYQTLRTSDGVAIAEPVNIICQKQGVDFKPKTAVAGTYLDAVTSPGAGKPVLCSAKISSTGVITDQIGGCITTCTNANPRVCTFTSSYWVSGSVPNCNATSQLMGAAWASAVATTTTLSIYTANDIGASSPQATNFQCHGLTP